MIAVTTASPLNTLTIERSLQIFVGTLKTTIFLEWLPEVPVPAQLPWQAVRCLGDQVRDIYSVWLKLEFTVLNSRKKLQFGLKIEFTV